VTGRRKDVWGSTVRDHVFYFPSIFDSLRLGLTQSWCFVLVHGYPSSPVSRKSSQSQVNGVTSVPPLELSN